MILQALYQLAEFEQLVDDPDFEVKPVSWAIRLNASGEFVGFEDLRTNLNEGTGKKPKYDGKPCAIPQQPYRAGMKPRAYFLVDNPKFVLGLAAAGTDFDVEEGVEYTKRFRELVANCYAATQDKQIQSILKFFDAYPPPSEGIPLPEDMRSNELIAFKVGLGDYCHNLPAVRSWWKDQCKATSEESIGQCLITGEPIFQIDQFPQTEGVPGAPKPIKLISYNDNVYESFGLKRNENAPISPKAGVFAATALNRLLHNAFPDPRDTNVTLPSRNLRISSDTAACFWSCSPQKSSQEFISCLPSLLKSESEDTVREVYRSLWRGREISLEDPSQFYVLILSGAQGRAVVRDWIVTTLPETQRHLKEHFSDLDIVRTASAKKGESWTSPVPLEWLMKSLAPEGKGDAIPASLEAGFVRAAFTGMAYPFQILQRALVRTRAEVGRSEWIDAVRRDARAALIRGVLNRRRRTDADASHLYPEVPVAMSPNLESEGYALGLLMAVLERLQVTALGDVNASVIDRYFGAASATPRAVFVRLLKNARHHARKAMDSDEGRDRALASRLDRMIDVLCDRFDLNRKQFPPQRCGLPAHLDLEQQGLFVLGYHQMRHWLWLSNEERKTWEREHPEAPAAFRWLKAEPAAA